MNGFSRLSIPLEVRAAGDNAAPGTIEGYGVVFGSKNSYGEIFAPDAFNKSLAERMPKMLAHHDVKRPCGVWDVVKPDQRGLAVRGRYVLDCEAGKDNYALMKAGAFDGLSIGFCPEVWTYDETTDTIIHQQVCLLEVSPVVFASDPMATAQVVRSALARNSVPSIRSLEAALRDAVGLSASGAKALLAGGYKALTRERDAMVSESKGSDELLAMLAKLSATIKG